MAYGRYFGFRSFENIVRDARHRVPATGNPIKIGAPIVVDTGTPGRLKAADEASKPGVLSGIAVYEHIQNKGDALTTSYDAPYDEVPLGQYAQMVHGVGVKVWFKESAGKSLYDGRPQPGYDWFEGNVSDITVGAGLTPAGGGKWRVTDGSNTADVGGPAWLSVEQVNPTSGLVECRFTF